MEDLKNIPRDSSWTSVTDKLNYNFSVLDSELSSINEKEKHDKGLYANLQELEADNINPNKGDWGYVGNSFPARLYFYDGTQWVNSGNTYNPGTSLSNLLKSQTVDISTLFEETEIFKINNGSYPNSPNRISITPLQQNQTIYLDSWKYGIIGGEKLTNSYVNGVKMLKSGYRLIGATVEKSDGTKIITSSDEIDKRSTTNRLEMIDFAIYSVYSNGYSLKPYESISISASGISSDDTYIMLKSNGEYYPVAGSLYTTTTARTVYPAFAIPENVSFTYTIRKPLVWTIGKYEDSGTDRWPEAGDWFKISANYRSNDLSEAGSLLQYFEFV